MNVKSSNESNLENYNENNKTISLFGKSIKLTTCYLILGLIAITIASIMALVFYLLQSPTNPIQRGDAMTYYNAMYYFVNGQDPYGKNVMNFVYLNYFCYLFFYWGYNYPISVITHWMMNLGISLYFIRIAYQHKKADTNLIYWILMNSWFLLYEICVLQFNLIVTLGIFLYYKYRDKHSSAILFLLLSFYKVSSIPVFLGIYVIDILIAKKFRWKELPFLLIVSIIIGYSYTQSLGMYRIIDDYGWSIYNVILDIIQPLAFLFFSFLIYVLFDQLEQHPIKQLQWILKNKQPIWIIYCIIVMIYYYINSLTFEGNSFFQQLLNN